MLHFHLHGPEQLVRKRAKQIKHWSAMAHGCLSVRQVLLKHSHAHLVKLSGSGTDYSIQSLPGPSWEKVANARNRQETKAVVTEQSGDTAPR